MTIPNTKSVGKASTTLNLPPVLRVCNRDVELPDFKGGIKKFSKDDLNALLRLVWKEWEPVSKKMITTPQGRSALMGAKRHMLAIIATVINRRRIILESRSQFQDAMDNYRDWKERKDQYIKGNFYNKIANRPSYFNHPKNGAKRRLEFIRSIADFRNYYSAQDKEINNYNSLLRWVEWVGVALESDFRRAEKNFQRVYKKYSAVRGYVPNVKDRRMSSVTIKDVASANKNGFWQYDGYKEALEKYQNFCSGRLTHLDRVDYSFKWAFIKQTIAEVAKNPDQFIKGIGYYCFVNQPSKSKYSNKFICEGTKPLRRKIDRRNCFTADLSLRKK